MPRQVTLSALEREALLLSPVSRDELIRWYTFSDLDLALVRQRRGDANRLGFAVQLRLLRYPGQELAVNAPADEVALKWIGQAFCIDPSCWPQYATREETCREHLLELRAYLGLASFGAGHYRRTVNRLCELAMQTDKSVVLAGQVLNYPESVIPGLGIVLLASISIYLIPRTAVLGAILLTGHLGGAVATHVCVGSNLFSMLLPIILGAMLWGGLFLRDAAVRALMPLRRD